MLEFVEPFVNREQAANAEQHQGDDETPEIAQLAVAERVLGVGFPAGLLETEEQQDLVAGIGIGMNRFRQHAAGPGDPGNDGLRNRDAAIGEEGIENGARSAAV